MVQITKNGLVLLIPKNVYEADYKNNGWKIVGEEQKEEKKIVSTPTKDIKEDKENKVVNSKKSKK